MKKLFIISAAFTLSLFMLFSCSKPSTPPSPEGAAPNAETPLMNSIYNPDAPYIYEKISGIQELELLGNLVETGKFFTVTKDDEATTRVYSTITGQELLKKNDTWYTTNVSSGEGLPTVTTRLITNYSIFTTPNGEFEFLATVFTEAKTSTYENYPISLPPRTTHQISAKFYDATGNLFYHASGSMLDDSIGIEDNQFEYMNSAVTYGDTNLFSIDNSVFSYDKSTGAVTKIKNFDTTAIPDFEFMSDEYYYAISRESSTLQIFDANLNKISTAVLPYDTELPKAKYGALPNGNVVLQYVKELPSDSAEYDIISVEELNGEAVSAKYDLVTLLITANTGELKSIDVGFVINSITDLDLLDKLSGTDKNKRSFYCASVIADIDYITEDKEYDSSYMYSDLVVLSDDCTIAHSFKRKSRWVDIPKMIGDGIFSVRTLNNEIEVIDRNGNIIISYGASFAGNSDRIIKTDRAVYNVTTGEKIFDAANSNAVIKSTSCDIFTVQNGSEISVILADGSVKSLGEIYGQNKTLDDFYASNLGYYYIVHSATGQHEYFNEYGEKLGMFDVKLEYLGKTFGGYLFFNSADGSYYKMPTTKVSNK